MLLELLPAIAPVILSLIINVIVICLYIGLRKKAKTDEEKSKLDEVIKNVVTNGVTSIKNICEAQGLKLNKKEVKKVAAATIKKELKK